MTIEQRTLRRGVLWVTAALLALSGADGGPTTLRAQAVISGRTLVPRSAGTAETMALSGVLCFASLNGPGREARSFRTWETEPAGWWRIDGGAGNYTLLFTHPAHFFRPVVLNNVFVQPGDKVDGFRITPPFDFASFHEKSWDPKAGTQYFQTFVARGRSVTSVGFRLAHDGVDGFGPRSQELVVSIHRGRKGTPDQWPQVGPALPVLKVDSGGGKNYIWSAGWNSGEVPLVPGETYAVHLRAATNGGVFQPFWRPDEDLAADCYRLGGTNTGWQRHDLWMAVGTDGDGLLIPYNKRVQREFGRFAGSARAWSQSYVAQGRGLASALLYAAVSGAQPPLSRQRAVVRVRQGGPRGPVVGIEKIATGNGNYTGDASWGRFGAAFAPGEVPIEPGGTYVIEFESIENPETLDGFVNIKGQISDGRAAFNPYRKHERETYEAGTSFKDGKDAMDFDLDMQLVEYESSGPNWSESLHERNLLRNGDFRAGDATTPNAPPGPFESWSAFTLDPRTLHLGGGDPGADRFARVAAPSGGTVDGGYVQRVPGLSRLDTYRLSGRVRASWATDSHRECKVGVDPTGQESDPQAATIQWTRLADLHGVWVTFTSQPLRPATNSISVWLRGRATTAGERWAPYKADFDDFLLQRVQTAAPGR